MIVGSDLARARLVSRSVDVISTHQSPSGAYPACPTFSAYRGYAWLRDGAFIAEGMSRAGEVQGVTAFHEWCAEVIGAREGQVESLVRRAAEGESVSPAEMLPTRFTLEGGDGTDEWWDHQLDGYGTWLWALAEHTTRHGAAVRGAERAVKVAATYLSWFWDQPCYDWWEEHVDQRHVSTLGAIHAGLRSAIGTGLLDEAEAKAAAEAVEGITALVEAEGVAQGGHLRKWLGSDEVDASLLSCVYPFGLYPADHPVAVATVAEVERQLAHEGGVHRYLADTFYGGGRWVLLAGFMGLNHAAAGRREQALRYLDWMGAQATDSGELPEQVSDVLLAPGRFEEWLQRWGSVATPLLWSHGMYLMLADALEVRS
ncbi:glycoside hydrolase family 15 protein [Nonomuraea dietziae]|uniref:GH15 family glucan-1,4-alpha-glucosidase n=1 Tax=Nonomuraea dietziae TaxID=65515 RepID=A0A7W5V1U0_9ACTN|nr:glycoside hydrolase family 15 protein [Nonomuraea dietziae]MBB3727244.1 GH15 family glucan-1,4-alpha-glucosidase [Nonomuraea dietziae]